MKNKILSFICFYLTVPLFVLSVMIFGGAVIGSVGRAAHANEPNLDNEYGEFFEKGLFPADMLDEIIELPDTMHPIIAKTISSESNILNETTYKINEAEILEHAPIFEYSSSSPLVLVIHTHATECYFEENEETKIYYSQSDYAIEGYYDENKTPTRTQDKEKNVVKVGEAFCDTLKSKGVASIHCTELFDSEDYTVAYTNSGNAVKEYLEEYPSIKLVIDIHRDSLISEEKVKVKTVADKLSSRPAQVMIVAGSDAGGLTYPDWKRSLALDLEIKEVMDSRYPSLARPIFLRASRYNQHLAYTSLLLEVGTCANTLSEAKSAAQKAAECVAEVILGS